MLDTGVVEGGVEEDAHQGEGRGGIRLEPGPERREGPAGTHRHLEGAHHPATVGRLHPGRRDRVEGGQPGVQALGAPREVRLGFEGADDIGEPTRHRQLVDDGPQVEPGPAHEQGTMPATLHRAEHVSRFGLKPAQREFLVGVDQVHQVVRHLGPLGATGLGGADVHGAVHAHRVDRHQLGLGAPARQLQGESGLPRRRRPHQCDVTGPDASGRAHEPYRAETGMCMRRRAPAVTRTSSPRR